MIIRNFLQEPLKEVHNCHKGEGTVLQNTFFKTEDFKTNLRFVSYMTMPQGTSIGIHEHGDNEELYIVLEGKGIMHVNGEEKVVVAGDVIVNPPFGTHGLRNDQIEELKLLVFEVLA